MAKKILVIDDEELVTKSLMQLLKKEGYKVTIAKSGKQALEEVKKKDFNLIVCDVRMPDMDGVETIRKIRKYLEQSQKETIREVLITGYADLDKYEESIGLEVSGFLNKPFDNTEFLKIIKENI